MRAYSGSACVFSPFGGWRLDVDEITAVLRTRRLRWYGHVQRATSCINSITRLGVPGTRNRGRPRKTWSACVRNDMTMYMQPGWCQPVRQEFMENECEALPGVAYPGVRDNRSTINTKTGYDDDDDLQSVPMVICQHSTQREDTSIYACDPGAVNRS